MSNGHWQKEIPSDTGEYWTATRDGYLNKIMLVSYEGEKLIYAGAPVSDDPVFGDNRWSGWWWSEPVRTPTPPPRDAWNFTP